MATEATQDEPASGTLRITELYFKAGAAPSSPPLKVVTGNITILVGSNNAGKSAALREIERACVQAAGAHSGEVVSWVAIDTPTTVEAVFSLLRPFRNPEAPAIDNPGNEQLPIAYVANGGPVATTIGEASVEGILQGNWGALRAMVMPPYTMRLDGRTRFSIPVAAPTGLLLSPAQNYLQGLFRDDDARRKVQDIAHDAFGRYMAIDASTQPGQLQLRMSKERPPADLERALTNEAAEFFAREPLLTTFGDGVQAFMAIIGTVIGSPHKVILIDEPEAFLPPPVARRLAGELARVARGRDVSLVVATHDADFLMGCLVEADDSTVVRLTYDDGAATARALEPVELTPLMSHPLFRSAGSLNALFHRGAIVTESDADRAFYDEINHRLLAVGRGVKDALFLNAQNWQTEQVIVRPLRRIGIPAAAVVDLDVAMDKGPNWTALFDACNVEGSRRQLLRDERDYVAAAFSRCGCDRRAVKTKGLSALGKTDRMRAQAWLDELALYGLFLVDAGELESWLPYVNQGGHSPEWLIAVFTRMAALEGTTDAITPRADDVWLFLDRVACWVHDPARKGMG